MLKTFDPFTGQTTGEFEFDELAKVQEKLRRLHSTQSQWNNLRLDDRLRVVKAGLEYFDKHRDQIAMDICEQMGRPFHQAKGELNGFFERADYMCSIAKESLQPWTVPDKPQFQRRIEHEAFGVIFVLAAWNFPLVIAVNSVVPGLLAGNTILLKHSNLTPKIGEHFAKAFTFEGQPLVMNTITSHHTTGMTIESGLVDHVIFTGSVAGGRSILEHTNKRFITPLLELGGKDAAYVHNDADLKHAIDTIVDGAMFNAGQSCCGIERAYIHESLYDDFIKGAQDLLQSFVLGDPKNEKTNMGPLAKASAADTMKAQLEQAVTGGAKVLCGGHAKQIEKGTFFEPTLVVDVQQDMVLMQEENFGPILPVMKVKNLGEAIFKANDSQFGLTAAIFTQSPSVAEEFAIKVKAGTIFMNRCDYLDPALPWTGYYCSGCGGSSLSRVGFMHVTRRKSIHFKFLQ